MRIKTHKQYLAKHRKVVEPKREKRVREPKQEQPTATGLRIENVFAGFFRKRDDYTPKYKTLRTTVTLPDGTQVVRRERVKNPAYQEDV